MGTSVPLVRKLVFYRGRVQGVGFRFTTRRMARGFAITGYVRNLSDGRVELLAEGESSEVGGFLDGVSVAMADHILDADVHSLPATGEYSTFEIRAS